MKKSVKKSIYMYECYKFTKKKKKKNNGDNIFNCNNDYFLFIKHLKALPLFEMELTLDTCEYLLVLFYFYFINFFKSGFTPCADI